jgi:uncharacterized surface protein with fasciclin (FAS1) repeats/nucleoid-associated protein YgaU
MIIRKKLWQTMVFIMVVAMLVSALPAMSVTAQTTPIVSSSVRGELNEQFAKHYLELRVTNPSSQVRIVMEVNPQDRQELDNRASFYVFDEAGFNRLVNSGDTTSNLATGALQTTGGVKQRVAVIANPIGGFSIVPFNDSNVPMDYTLTVENGVFVDSSGEQVTNALETSQTVAQPAEAAATATPAAAVTTTVTATATVTPTTVAAPVAAEATVVQVVSRIVRVAELEGELNERFAKHYFELETEDISRPVVLEMTYNPQDQQAVDTGLNFYVLTQEQFARWTSTSQPNTSVGSLLSGTPKTKRANIEQPLRNYTVVVSNDSDIAADYTLTVQNAILIDESGQSTTAQALGATGVTTTTVVPGTTTTVTGTTTTTAAATPAAPAANAITPPTTYTVVSGDTLSIIARRAYGNIQLYQQLCTFNNIADCNRIEIGDQIQIPLQSQLGGTATTTTAAAAPAPTPAAAAAPAATTVVTTTTPATTTTTTTTTTTPANAGASGDLVATTGSLSVLDTLGLLLDLLELEQDQTNNVKALLQGGTFTFFAPTDTAFTSLDEATLESLIANPAQLAAVLKAHIVPGQLRAADLSSGSSLQTLAGTSLPVSVSGNVVTIGGARVSQADVLATNGVIHIIDSVLVQ